MFFLGVEKSKRFFSPKGAKIGVFLLQKWPLFRPKWSLIFFVVFFFSILGLFFFDLCFFRVLVFGNGGRGGGASLFSWRGRQEERECDWKRRQSEEEEENIGVWRW